MSKHTPGPWAIVARDVMEEDDSVYPKHIVGGELAHTICFLETQHVAEVAVQKPGTHWDTTPQKEANARLIAAAPDLLEALEAFVAPFDRLEAADGGHIAKARAAIAKAKGES